MTSDQKAAVQTWGDDPPAAPAAPTRGEAAPGLPAEVPVPGEVSPEPSAGGPAGSQARVYRAARQDKPWGHEEIFAAVEGMYAGKIIHVTAGQSLSLQYHRDKDETISVLSGTADIQYGPVGGELTQRRFGPGDTIHVPARLVHRVTAVTDLVFAEASSAAPGWREDVVRLQDAYGRTGTSAP